MQNERIVKRLRCPCCGGESFDPRLIPAIIATENAVGYPLIITSGYRCKMHNEELIAKGLPASKNSQHCLGKAVDVFCLKKKQNALILAAKAAGFRGVGIGPTFLHLDLGEDREWHYPA